MKARKVAGQIVVKRSPSSMAATSMPAKEQTKQERLPFPTSVIEHRRRSSLELICHEKLQLKKIKGVFKKF